MTDPVADFLTRLRNASKAHHESLSVPYSKLKGTIADILKAEGYIDSYKVEDAKVGKSLVVNLKYGVNREASIAGIKRFPSRDCVYTPRAPNYQRFSVAWASQSFPPRAVY
jgi:small subunit ribosomal protein S8